MVFWQSNSSFSRVTAPHQKKLKERLGSIGLVCMLRSIPETVFLNMFSYEIKIATHYVSLHCGGCQLITYIAKLPCGSSSFSSVLEARAVAAHHQLLDAVLGWLVDFIQLPIFATW